VKVDRVLAAAMSDGGHECDLRFCLFSGRRP
jgi:hypothetical protein